MNWDPFDEMRRMQNDMDMLFKKTASMAAFGKFRQPVTDMINKDKEIIIIAELPGMEKEDIDIDVKPFMITISAENRRGRTQERSNYYYKERSATAFKRTLTLPEEVAPEKAEADFKNGILEITMPKKHFIRRPDKGKRIHIK